MIDIRYKGDNDKYPIASAMQYNANSSQLYKLIRECMQVDYDISEHQRMGQDGPDVIITITESKDQITIQPYDWVVVFNDVDVDDPYRGMRIYSDDDWVVTFERHEKPIPTMSEPIEVEVAKHRMILRDVTDDIFIRKVDELESIELKAPSLIIMCEHLKPQDVDLSRYKWFKIVGDEDSEAVYTMPRGQYSRCTAYYDVIEV